MGAWSNTILLLFQAFIFLHHSQLASSTSVFSMRNAMIEFNFFATDDVIPTVNQSCNSSAHHRLRNPPLGGGHPDNRAETSSLLFHVPVIVYNMITNMRCANRVCAWTQITFIKANRKLNCPRMLRFFELMVFVCAFQPPLSMWTVHLHSTTATRSYTTGGNQMETGTLSKPKSCCLPTDSASMYKYLFMENNRKQSPSSSAF